VVAKSNFLAVYAEAHTETLTEANIKAVFRKTGVIPLNHDVVTEDMMAPSLESSSQGTLPIQQSSPVKLMAGMITDYMDYQCLQTMPMDMDLPSIDPTSSSPAPFFMCSAVDNLPSTSAAFLVTSSPLKSTSAPPAFKPYTISPVKHGSRYSHLFEHAPRTTQEAELMLALQESEGRNNSRKQSMIEMQASTVLAGMYNNRTQSQLQAVEERKRRKTGN
jgi:hypothetical protein